MFYHSLCIAVIKSCSNRPTNCLFSLCKLLDCGFIQEKNFTLLCFIPIFILLGKGQHFHFMVGIKQDFCAGLNVFRLKSFAETGWRPNSYLPNQVVITRACFSWPFLVMVKFKILKSSNCLMNSHFATAHFFAYLLSCAKLKFKLSVLDKLAFFTLKNYKNTEETAQIFFNQACTEYCVVKHV